MKKTINNMDIKMKILSNVSIILLILTSAPIGREPVNFEDLLNYIEISADDSLVGKYYIRAETLLNSFLVYSDYKFIRENGSYYLSIYLDTPKNDRKKIDYMSWGGIKITIQDTTINLDINAIYYKDKTGIHKIMIGRKSSWKIRMEKKWNELKNKLIIPDSVYVNALKDI